jgi:hypothetical protein
LLPTAALSIRARPEGYMRVVQIVRMLSRMCANRAIVHVHDYVHGYV